MPPPPGPNNLEEERLRAASRVIDGNTLQTEFHVPDMHCIACVRKIERSLSKLAFVSNARANLSTRRVRVTWQADNGQATRIAGTLAGQGFDHALLQAGVLGDSDDATFKHLLLCLGVAGFAAANVMLLSVSVWSGADAETRQLFHLISGLIAIPAAAYAGRPFFSSALRALSHRRLNMDVPISLAVVLALAMSVSESLSGGAEAYFDAAVMLLFFLLIGRTLDHMMRDRARDGVKLLSRLSAKGAIVIEADGSQHYVATEKLQPGTRVFVAAGERVPVDGIVRLGTSELDRALVTGESRSQPIGTGDRVEAGTINLTGPIEIEATKTADTSFIGEVVAMMEAAEQGKARFVRIADRVARIYAPAVHIIAFLAFAAWMLATGGDWKLSAYTAIAVLIITCPCALGLAVPIVHVVSAGRLFEHGILMKDGGALERLREIDTVVFDKTGTLTLGRPDVIATGADGAQLALAGALAAQSKHPAADAVARHGARFGSLDHVTLHNIREVAGFGIEARHDGRAIRLGRRSWVAEITDPASSDPDPSESTVWFGKAGGKPVCFEMRDALRPGARQAVERLLGLGLRVEILSGDAVPAVRTIADELAIANWQAEQTPSDKIGRIEALKRDGCNVLMVGDGLNDAPALAAGHVSMAPSSGSDVGRQAADFVLTGESLASIPFAHDIAERANALVKQNIALAVAYNCIAVPLAAFGYVTPLVAAIAMSASSIVVVANSLRLRLAGGTWDAPPFPQSPRTMYSDRYAAAAPGLDNQT